MQWMQGGAPARAPAGTSPTHRGVFAIQNNCQDALRAMLDAARLVDEQSPTMPVGPNGETAQQLFHLAMQRKNECFARALCPGPYATALQCVLDPQRVATGACEASLTAASQCRTAFWDHVMRPEGLTEGGGVQRNLMRCSEPAHADHRHVHGDVRAASAGAGQVLCGLRATRGRQGVRRRALGGRGGARELFGPCHTRQV